MISFNVNKPERFMELRVKMSGNVENRIEDVLEVLDLMSIVQTDRCPVGPTAEFLADVMNNITNDKWTMRPEMWAEYLANAEHSPPASDIQKRNTKVCVEMYNTMLVATKMLPHHFNTKSLLLHWVRNPNGLQSILSTGKALIDLQNFFAKG